MNNKRMIALLFVFISMIFVLTGCFGGGDSDSGDSSSGTYQSTLFKIYDTEGNIIDNADFDIEGVNTSGNDGMFKAHLKAGQVYNLNINSKYFSNIREERKINKGDKIIKLTLKRDQFSVLGRILKNSKPVENVTIKIGEKSTKTNSDGYFKFDNVSADNKKLEISAIGYKERNITYDINKENAINKDSVNIPDFTFLNDSVVDIGEIELTSLPQQITGLTNPHTKITLASNSSKYVVSDNNGYFTFKNIFVGTYNLVFSNSNYYSKTLNDVLIKNNNVDIGEFYLTAKPNSVTGSTLLNATVELNGETINITDVANTDFTFNDVPAGTHTLIISHNDYENYTQEITVNANDNVDLGNIDLNSLPGWIEGTVTNDVGEDIFSANVRINELSLSTFTNSDGYYKFNNIPEDTNYQMEIIEGNHKPKTISNIEVQKNKATVEDIVLVSKTGTLRGATQPNTTVTIGSNSDTAKDNGSFEITGIKQGAYDVTFEHSDYDLKTVSNVYITKNQITDIGSISLTAKPGSITGSGSNIQNSNVKLLGFNNELIQEITDLSSNSFVFINISVGNYAIQIEREGYLTYKSSEFDLKANQTFSLDNIELAELNTPTGNLDVEVSSGAGGTLSGADVIVSELPAEQYDEEGTVIDSSYNNKTTPNADWQDIREGTYKVSAYKEGYYINKENITVLDGDDVNGAITLIPIPDNYEVKTYSGTVSHGQTLPHAQDLISQGYDVNWIVSPNYTRGWIGDEGDYTQYYCKVSSYTVSVYARTRRSSGAVRATYTGTANYLVVGTKKQN